MQNQNDDIVDDCRCYDKAPACKPAAKRPESACKPAAKPADPCDFAVKPTKPCCPCPCPAEKCKVTLQTVQKLVDAENKDIELAELLAGIQILDEKRPKKKIISAYDAMPKKDREDPVNYADPHYLAYMMRLIENGLSMKTNPIEVYEHLFSKGNPDAPLVELSPTAAISTEDMMVPLSAPTVVSSKDPELELGARLGSIIPRVNVAVAEASDAVQGEDDLRVMLGGSGPRANDGDFPDDDGRPIEMKLETRTPVHSEVVLRGSTAPKWFPGYNVALPDTALPAVVADPEAVLDEAWFHSQPLSLRLDDKGAKLIGK